MLLLNCSLPKVHESLLQIQLVSEHVVQLQLLGNGLWSNVYWEDLSVIILAAYCISLCATYCISLCATICCHMHIPSPHLHPEFNQIQSLDT